MPAGRRAPLQSGPTRRSPLELVRLPTLHDRRRAAGQGPEGRPTATPAGARSCSPVVAQGAKLARTFWGQGLVRPHGVVRRLRHPPAQGQDVRPQRGRDRPPAWRPGGSRPRSSGPSCTTSTAGSRSCPPTSGPSSSGGAAGRSARSSSCCRASCPRPVMKVVTEPVSRPLPRPAGDPPRLHLPRFRPPVQARGGRHLRRRHPARRRAGPAVQAPRRRLGRADHGRRQLPPRPPTPAGGRRWPPTSWRTCSARLRPARRPAGARHDVGAGKVG